MLRRPPPKPSTLSIRLHSLIPVDMFLMSDYKEDGPPDPIGSNPILVAHPVNGYSDRLSLTLAYSAFTKTYPHLWLVAGNPHPHAVTELAIPL